MRRKDLTEAQWIAHKKLCKKRASAKWYVKKRSKELEELQQQKAMQREQERLKEAGMVPEWTPEQRREWRCQLLYRTGWPVRPPTVSTTQWLSIIEHADRQWQTMKQHEFAQHKDPELMQRMARHLLVQELLAQRQKQQAAQPQEEEGEEPQEEEEEQHPPPAYAAGPPPEGWRFTPSAGLWVCSALGLVFLRLSLDGALHLWPQVCAWWQQNMPAMNHNRLHPEQSHWEQTDPRNHMAPIQTPIIQDPSILQIIAGK